MQPDKQITEEQKRRRRVTNLELFYYERVGTRSYLRITRFGIVLILILTAISIIALLFLFLWNQSTPPPKIDVTIKPMPAANTSIYPTINQQPPPPAPKTLRQLKAARPSPSALPSPIENSNER